MKWHPRACHASCPFHHQPASSVTALQPPSITPQPLAARSHPTFLYEVLAEVIKAGATTLNIPDTTGWSLPHEFQVLRVGSILAVREAACMFSTVALGGSDCEQAGHAQRPISSLYRASEPRPRFCPPTQQTVLPCPYQLIHMQGLITDLRANVPGANDVIFSTHCQNDLGLSTANSLAGGCRTF